jgi:hypothetical protein
LGVDVTKEQKKLNTSAQARATLAAMPPHMLRKIRRLIGDAVEEQDFPKFKAGLIRLGYDENSAVF